MMDLTAMLAKDEGLRLQVYDDATGYAIGPGSNVRGHPTIGYGICLDAAGGITTAEAVVLLANRIAAVRLSLAGVGWWKGLDSVRQDAIVAMAYQMGLSGVAAFHVMIAALRDERWQDASAAMLDSLWAHETPSRAYRTANMIASGRYA